MKLVSYTQHISTLANTYTLYTIGKSKQYYKRIQLTLFIFALLSVSLNSFAQENIYKADAILTAPVNEKGIAAFIQSQQNTNNGQAQARNQNEGEVVSPIFGAVSGPDFVCAYEEPVTYSVATATDAQGNALQFYWFVPTDWVILSGQGTNEITVLPGLMSGQVAVFAMGYCICTYACKPVISEDCGGITPLPVEFISFEASRAQGAVLLNWATAQETNNDRFEIETSKDGYSFQKIGVVKGNGTTSARSDYSFTHQNAANNTAYYRLKQIDQDGKFEYSPVRVVEEGMNSLVNLEVYPNPTRDFLNLKNADNLDGKGTIKITSVTGQLVYSGTVNDLTGNNNRLDISHLNAGVYIATISAGQTTQSIRVIKN